MAEQDIITVSYECDKCGTFVERTLNLAEIPDEVECALIQCTTCPDRRCYNLITRQFEDVPEQ